MATENNDLNVLKVFLRFSRGNLQASLKRIKTIESLIDDRIRGQALYALKIGFRLGQDVWPETVQLLIEMSPKMEQGGYWDEWIWYLEQGVELSQSFEDVEARVELKLELGVLYKYRSEYDRACSCFEDCIEVFKKLLEQEKQAKALYRLAHVMDLQGKYDEAKKLGSQALILFDRNEEGQAHCHSILGVVFYNRHEWEASFHHFLNALYLHQQHHNKREIARSFLNLGAIQQTQEEIESAINYYQKAICLFEKICDPNLLAIAQMNLGTAYSQKKQYLTALALYESAELNFQRVQENLRLAQIYTNKAKLYHEMQKWEQAEYACLRGIEYWESLNDIWNLANIMDELGLIYVAQAQYKKAVTIFQCGLTNLQKISGQPNHTLLHDLLAEHLETYSLKLAAME